MYEIWYSPKKTHMSLISHIESALFEPLSSRGHIGGHSTTTWTTFQPILTPYTPGVYYGKHFTWYVHTACTFLNFMQGFKSAILAIFQFCQNGTFEPVHDIRNFFLPKTFFWSIMKMAIRKFFHNLSQGPPNPGFMQEKVQKGDFLKKDSRELKFFSCFRFLWISRRPGTLNWERVVFLLSKIIYRKCGLTLTSKKWRSKFQI